MKEKKPKITVVTVCYNAVKEIERTMQSVLNQTYPNIEYIIIDGASTDGTVDVIKKYADRLAYWVSEPDKGIYDAMNKGIKHATGEWLYFIGAGDVLHENFVFDKAVAHFTMMDTVYYGDVIFNQINKKYWGKFNRIKLGIGNICHQCIFYPRSVYTKYKYETKYRIFADYVYNINLYGLYKFNYIDVVIANYDTVGVSYTSKDSEFSNVKRSLIIKKLGILSYLTGVAYRSIWKIKHYNGS